MAWNGEKKLVTAKKNVDVVESYEEDDFTRIDPEGVTVGENGKIWVQGRVVGGLVVAGESACVELQVKNHSSKRVGNVVLANETKPNFFSDYGSANFVDPESSPCEGTSIRASSAADLRYFDYGGVSWSRVSRTSRHRRCSQSRI